MRKVKVKVKVTMMDLNNVHSGRSRIFPCLQYLYGEIHPRERALVRVELLLGEPFQEPRLYIPRTGQHVRVSRKDTLKMKGRVRGTFSQSTPSGY